MQRVFPSARRRTQPYAREAMFGRQMLSQQIFARFRRPNDGDEHARDGRNVKESPARVESRVDFRRPTRAEMTEHISLTPLKESQVPHNRSDPNYDTFIHSLVTSSARFLDSLPPAGESNNIWQFHKTFHKSKCPTHTYSSNLDAPPPGVPRLGSFRWHLRVSLHAQSKYEDFRDGLLLNHSENEAKYIDSCVKADKLRTLEDGVLEGELFDGATRSVNS